MPPVGAERPPRPVHPGVARTAAYAWRLLVIGVATAAGLWVIGQMLVVVIPLVVAVLLTRALRPLAARLERRRVPSSLAALLVLLGFLVAVAGVVTLTGAGFVSETDNVRTTVEEGIDDLEDWLVEDSPFDVSRADVERWREEAIDALRRFVSSSQDTIVSGAAVAADAVVGLLLALIVTFFFLKDGPRMVAAARSTVASPRRATAMRLAQRAWNALGGYLAGAALLGLVEGTTIGLTILLVGGDLALPVAVFTFVAAFVPIVGAITAGVLAVVVTLVTAGPGAALIVGVVVLVVQQLDNDLLAPVVYGRALQLHPLVILIGIAAGGALFGFVGTVLAVPVLAVTFAVVDEWRNGEREDEPAAAGPP